MLELALACFNGLTSGTGNICVLDDHNPPVIKYYEPGKSCYINGTFYIKCEESNGTL